MKLIDGKYQENKIIYTILIFKIS